MTAWPEQVDHIELLRARYEPRWAAWPARYPRTLEEAEQMARDEGRPWPPPYPDERPDPLAEPEGYGRKPGQEPDKDSETCVYGDCQRESAWRLMLGDLGEHIAQLNLCTECALEHLSKRLECKKCKAPMSIGRIEPMRGQPADDLEQIRGARMQAALDSLRGPFGR